MQLHQQWVAVAPVAASPHVAASPVVDAPVTAVAVAAVPVAAVIAVAATGNFLSPAKICLIFCHDLEKDIR